MGAKAIRNINLEMSEDETFSDATLIISNGYVNKRPNGIYAGQNKVNLKLIICIGTMLICQRQVVHNQNI